MLPKRHSKQAYLTRYIDYELDELIEDLSGIAIDGPKGVGKTATASLRSDVVLALDDVAVRQVVEADAKRQLTAKNVVSCLFASASSQQKMSCVLMSGKTIPQSGTR